jgi:hypothetical protein
VHQAQLPKWRQAATDAILSGTCASITSAATLALCSQLEEGRPAGGINGPSQWIWGEREAYARDTSVRHTAVGYAIHHLASVFWAILYERAVGARRGRKKPARILLEATAISTCAFVVDYGLTPKRLQPGFEKHLSPTSMAAVYAMFAVGLAAATLYRQRRAAWESKPRGAAPT